MSSNDATYAPALAATHRELVWARYADLFEALDSNDVTGFVECFTPDGSIHVAGRGTSTGQDELTAYIPATSAGRPCHHFVNFRILELGLESATAQAAFTLVAADTGELYARGKADGRLRLLDQDSKFERVSFTFDWTSESYAKLGRGAME